MRALRSVILHLRRTLSTHDGQLSNPAGCLRSSANWPQVPFLPADVAWFRQKEKELNAMLAAQASANGATYVDLYTPSIGHDACRNSSTRWVEPLLPGNLAAPYHPNANGMSGFAAATVTALRAAGL